MKKEHFDEYQVGKRHKIEAQSLIVMIALVFINGQVSKNYMWADPDVQSYFIMMIPIIYFVTLAIFKNAYLSNRTKYPVFTVILFLGFGALMAKKPIIGFSEMGIGYFIENMKLTEGSVELLLSVVFMHTGTMLLIKCLIEKVKELKEQ